MHGYKSEVVASVGRSCPSHLENSLMSPKGQSRGTHIGKSVRLITKPLGG